MAEITITAMSSSIGPSLPTKHFASIGQKEWPGGGTVDVLKLSIGPETITIWPFDAEYVRDLGKRLIELADTKEAAMKGTN